MISHDLCQSDMEIDFNKDVLEFFFLMWSLSFCVKVFVETVKARPPTNKSSMLIIWRDFYVQCEDYIGISLNTLKF